MKITKESIGVERGSSSPSRIPRLSSLSPTPTISFLSTHQVLLSALLLTVASASVMATSMADSLPASPAMVAALSVKWLPLCSEQGVKPYFSIDVFDDGTVRYEGGDQARERGKRELHLDPSAFGELMVAAKGVQRESTTSAYKNADEDAPAYCLEVTQRQHGGERVAKGVAAEKRMQKLISAFDELIRAQHWVCPARLGGDALPTPLSSSICDDSRNVVFELGTFDELGCVVHGVDVYRDAVRYNAFKPTIREGRVGLPNTLIADEARPISAQQFNDLLLEVKALNLVQDQIYEEGPNAVSPEHYVNTTPYTTSDKAEFERIKNAVLRLTGLNWVELRPGTERCSEYGGTGTLLLRYQYGPPTPR